jgi:hypothetical protein
MKKSLFFDCAGSLVSSGSDISLIVAFLQATLLMPRSVTSYFNFPKWFYYGSDESALPVPYGQRKIA